MNEGEGGGFKSLDQWGDEDLALAFEDRAGSVGNTDASVLERNVDVRRVENALMFGEVGSQKPHGEKKPTGLLDTVGASDAEKQTMVIEIEQDVDYLTHMSINRKEAVKNVREFTNKLLGDKVAKSPLSSFVISGIGFNPEKWQELGLLDITMTPTPPFFQYGVYDGRQKVKSKCQWTPERDEKNKVGVWSRPSGEDVEEEIRREEEETRIKRCDAKHTTWMVSSDCIGDAIVHGSSSSGRSRSL